MREIKFRAWDGERMTTSDCMPDIGFWKFVAYSSDTNVMQYTGIKDKNGKEIYEGDIVNVWGQSSNIASVGFLQGCFTLNWNDGSNTDLLGWYSFKRSVASDPKDFEIIGNIYDNPELLTPKPKSKLPESELSRIYKEYTADRNRKTAEKEGN